MTSLSSAPANVHKELRRKGFDASFFPGTNYLSLATKTREKILFLWTNSSVSKMSSVLLHSSGWITAEQSTTRSWCHVTWSKRSSWEGNRRSPLPRWEEIKQDELPEVCRCAWMETLIHKCLLMWIHWRLCLILPNVGRPSHWEVVTDEDRWWLNLLRTGFKHHTDNNPKRNNSWAADLTCCFWNVSRFCNVVSPTTQVQNQSWCLMHDHGGIIMNHTAARTAEAWKTPDQKRRSGMFLTILGRNLKDNFSLLNIV